MKKSSAQLDVLLRARIPVIWTVSYEEARVVAQVAGIVEKNNLEWGSNIVVWQWSVTSGMNLVGPKVDHRPDVDSPVSALEFVREHGEHAVFLLKDFGFFLNGPSGYMVQRRLRDVIAETTALGLGTSIIILDSVLQVPDRIEKDVSVVDFDLPTEDELSDHLAPQVVQCADVAALSAEEREKLLYAGVQSARGLTLTEAENVVAKSMAETGTVDPVVIIGEKKHIIRRSGVLEFFDTDNSLRDVGGLDVLKAWLSSRGRAYTKEARAFGLPSPKGILLVGIPGTGKSLMAKSVGREWNMPVLRMDVGALFGQYVGQSEANMRKALKTAESMAPCVLWIDEIEKSIGGGGGSHDGGTTSRVFASLLSWMQDKKEDVFVVATANDVSALPPEMLRKGRFDEMFFVDLPDKAGREEILTIHIAKAKRDVATVDLDELATRSVNFSGAELESAVQSALFSAFERGEELSTSGIAEAMSGTVPLLTTMREKIDALRTWAATRAKPASSRIPESAVELREQKRRNGAVAARRPVMPSITGAPEG